MGPGRNVCGAPTGTETTVELMRPPALCRSRGGYGNTTKSTVTAAVAAALPVMVKVPAPVCTRRIEVSVASVAAWLITASTVEVAVTMELVIVTAAAAAAIAQRPFGVLIVALPGVPLESVRLSETPAAAWVAARFATARNIRVSRRAIASSRRARRATRAAR